MLDSSLAKVIFDRFSRLSTFLFKGRKASHLSLCKNHSTLYFQNQWRIWKTFDERVKKVWYPSIVSYGWLVSLLHGTTNTENTKEWKRQKNLHFPWFTVTDSILLSIWLSVCHQLRREIHRLWNPLRNAKCFPSSMLVSNTIYVWMSPENLFSWQKKICRVSFLS